MEWGGVREDLVPNLMVSIEYKSFWYWTPGSRLDFPLPNPDKYNNSYKYYFTSMSVEFMNYW